MYIRKFSHQVATLGVTFNFNFKKLKVAPGTASVNSTTSAQMTKYMRPCTSEDAPTEKHPEGCLRFQTFKKWKTPKVGEHLFLKGLENLFKKLNSELYFHNIWLYTKKTWAGVFLFNYSPLQLFEGTELVQDYLYCNGKFNHFGSDVQVHASMYFKRCSNWSASLRLVCLFNHSSLQLFGGSGLVQDYLYCNGKFNHFGSDVQVHSSMYFKRCTIWRASLSLVSVSNFRRARGFPISDFNFRKVESRYLLTTQVQEFKYMLTCT